MATIIDSLVVMLGLDSKELVAKTPEAVKSLSSIEKTGEKTEKTVQGLSRGLASLLSVIGGAVAIKVFVTDFIQANAELDRFSKNLGLSVSTISAWSQASERLGGSAQGLQGTLDMLSRSQTQFMLTGESSLIPYMSALGVALADVNGKARPVTDILLDLSDRFSHMDRTTANNLGRMMGLDQGTMNLLLQGRKELELEIARQKEHNAVTAAQAAEASKLQKAIIGLRQDFAGLGRTLLSEALPYLEKGLALLENFVAWAQQNKEFIADFLKVIAVGLASVALAASPIGLTAAAVIALAGAIALLWQDYQTWQRGGDSFIKWEKWEPGIKAAKEAITGLDDLLHRFIASMKLYADLAENLHGLFSVKMIAGMIPEFSIDQKKMAQVKKDLGDLYRDDDYKKPMADPFGLNDANPIKGNTKSGEARRLADRVSKQTGIPADIIWSQWAHETGGFTNRGALDLNNLAGINVPGGKGKDYRKFGTLDNFADYYASLLQRKYPDALNARSVEDFAGALKAGGYYGDTQQNYAQGMRRWDRQFKAPDMGFAQSISGIPGASGIAAAAPGAGSTQPMSVDKSTQVQIDQLTVQTQATDGPGIARDLWNSLDFTLASQANSGLVP
jgi:mannosyl-glycoprotein endo-beta-N-acetylglucosaminidase